MLTTSRLVQDIFETEKEVKEEAGKTVKVFILEVDPSSEKIPAAEISEVEIDEVEDFGKKVMAKFKTKEDLERGLWKRFPNSVQWFKGGEEGSEEAKKMKKFVLKRNAVVFAFFDGIEKPWHVKPFGKIDFAEI